MIFSELTAEQLAAINRQLLENAGKSGSPSILANGNSNLGLNEKISDFYLIIGFPSDFGGLLNNTDKAGERPNPLNNNRENLNENFRDDNLQSIDTKGE